MTLKSGQGDKLPIHLCRSTNLTSGINQHTHSHTQWEAF